MAIDKKELFKKLLAVLPVVAQLLPDDGGPLELIQQIVATGEAEISRRMSQGELSREEVLQDAAATWYQDLKKAASLELLGHENDQQSAAPESTEKT